MKKRWIKRISGKTKGESTFFTDKVLKWTLDLIYQ